MHQQILDYLNALSEGPEEIADGFVRADFLEYITDDADPIALVQELTSRGQLDANDEVTKFWAHLLKYCTHHL